jgi:hypothetical protein
VGLNAECFGSPAAGWWAAPLPGPPPQTAWGRENGRNAFAARSNSPLSAAERGRGTGGEGPVGRQRDAIRRASKPSPAENVDPARQTAIPTPPLPRSLGEGSPAVARNEQKAGGGEGPPRRRRGGLPSIRTPPNHGAKHGRTGRDSCVSFRFWPPLVSVQLLRSPRKLRAPIAQMRPPGVRSSTLPVDGPTSAGLARAVNTAHL